MKNGEALPEVVAELARVAAELGDPKMEALLAFIKGPGRPPEDDREALVSMARFIKSGQANSIWEAAESIAEQEAGHSVNATAKRLDRKFKKNLRAALASATAQNATVDLLEKFVSFHPSSLDCFPVSLDDEQFAKTFQEAYSHTSEWLRAARELTSALAALIDAWRTLPKP